MYILMCSPILQTFQRGRPAAERHREPQGTVAHLRAVHRAQGRRHLQPDQGRAEAEGEIRDAATVRGVETETQ